jgi:predicted DCC family thiol-disulfide oxidoreductase YuxK
MKSGPRQPLILFDGICNLCESSVQFVIRHDKSARYRFASLQSDAAQRVLREYAYDDEELGSVLLVADGRIYQKSRAALRIAKYLDGGWPILYYLFFWIPPVLADVIYDFIGNRRYQWFGQKDECWIPDEHLRKRFVKD